MPSFLHVGKEPLTYETKQIFSLPGTFREFQEAVSANSHFSLFFVMKHKNNKFGGFASQPWDLSRPGFSGDKNCFLFNLTKNVKILPSRATQNDNKFLSVKTSNQSLLQFGFGDKDLVFLDDFRSSSSILENCYTVKQKDKNYDASNFLAGQEVFTASAIEVWTII